MKRNTSNWSNFCMLLRREVLSASAGLSCYIRPRSASRNLQTQGVLPLATEYEESTGSRAGLTIRLARLKHQALNLFGPQKCQGHVFNRDCTCITADVRFIFMQSFEQKYQNFIICVSIDKRASASGGFVPQIPYPNRNRRWSPVAFNQAPITLNPTLIGSPAC